MIAVRNIFRKKIRSLLTLVGIAIGLSVYISLSSISTSLKSEIQGIVRKYNIDVIVQPKGADPFVASRIAEADYHRLKSLQDVRDIYPLITGYLKTPWNPHLFVLGVDSIDALSGRFSLAGGRLLLPGKKELLLGSATARDYSYVAENKIVLADNEMYTIAGIHHFGNRIADSAVILNMADAQRVLKRGDNINMVFMNVRQGQDIDAFIAAVNRAFPELLALRSANLAKESHLLGVVDFFVWVLSTLSFIACTVIIMNTLFMNVSERTGEIGILMAIGWSPFMIFRTIVLEAVLVCMAGAAAGVVLSKAMLSVVARQHILSSAFLSASISPDIAVKAFAFSIILGIMGSLFPAVLASRLQPAQALRYE